MTSTDPMPTKSTAPSSSTYPFATAPDIIRTHQKDAYFRAQLLSQLCTLVRCTLGSRVQHTYSAELSTLSDTLYLCLTTLMGNRTLGEEYCDLIQVSSQGRLPPIHARASYIVSAILVPYALNRLLPRMRNVCRRLLEWSLPKDASSLRHRVTRYTLSHVATILSPSPLQAATLTAFYFTGTYYQLSKRVVGLRYIFPQTPPASQARVGYEVLGVLLVLQIGVQTYVHVRSMGAPTTLNSSSMGGGSALVGGGAEVSLDSQAYASNNELLFSSPRPPSRMTSIEKITHTEVRAKARYSLRDGETMAWISMPQARKCTLCLEELKDPSVVACGHVFCWECIWDWVREKAECPLCRRDVLGQHILPLRS